MRRTVINWFDYNDDAPSFEWSGASKAGLQRCAALVRSSAGSKKQKQLAATGAAALALPALVTRAKLPKQDAAALLAVASALAPAAAALGKTQPKRKAGRPKTAEKVMRQALALIGADWLTKLKHGALSRYEARKQVSALIPTSLLEPGPHREKEKARKHVKPLEQLGRWEEAFAKKKDDMRQQIMREATEVLKDEWRAEGRNALDFSREQVLERVRRALA